MKTRFEEIVNVQEIGKANTRKINELLHVASNETPQPNKTNQKRHLLLAIDMQNDFMEHGELGVPGSHQDIERLTRFIYNHLQEIDEIAVSIDTHQPKQIFHPTWWVDQQGNHPKPFTIITTDDLNRGIYTARFNQKESYEYVEYVEKIAKKPLCIWTYHCIEGTFGAALEGQFANMVYFHAIATNTTTRRIIKGTNPLSEMYGIMQPEYDKTKSYEEPLLAELENYDTIIIAGEAKSHCVLESVRQIAAFYQNRKDVTSRIVILEDCMSVIPGFEEATEKAFSQLEEEYQIRRVRSTEFVLNEG